MDVCMMYGFITSDAHLHTPAGVVRTSSRGCMHWIIYDCPEKYLLQRRFHDAKLKANRLRRSANFFISFLSTTTIAMEQVSVKYQELNISDI